MQYAYIFLALAGSMLLSACTHDFDTFKPRSDGGADGSVQASSLDPADDIDLDSEPDAGD